MCLPFLCTFQPHPLGVFVLEPAPRARGWQCTQSTQRVSNTACSRYPLRFVKTKGCREGYPSKRAKTAQNWQTTLCARHAHTRTYLHTRTHAHTCKFVLLACTSRDAQSNLAVCRSTNSVFTELTVCCPSSPLRVPQGDRLPCWWGKSNLQPSHHVWGRRSGPG